MSVKRRLLGKEEGRLSLEVVEELVLVDPLEREREETQDESAQPT